MTFKYRAHTGGSKKEGGSWRGEIKAIKSTPILNTE